MSYLASTIVLKVAHCGNADCTLGNTLTTVDSVGSVGFSTSIAIGTDGFPVVSHFDNGNRGLKVAHCGNTDCTAGNSLTTVDAGAVVEIRPSITIGTDGFPVLSYSETNLKVAHCGNVSCTP